MEILQLIAHKLQGFGITANDETNEIALAEVDQAIKNYCHINCIPKELLFVRANLVVDYVRYIEANKPKENSGDITVGADIGPLTSIKSGDVTYQFGNNSANSIKNAHTTDLDSFLQNYENQLNNFRRVRW